MTKRVVNNVHVGISRQAGMSCALSTHAKPDNKRSALAQVTPNKIVQTVVSASGQQGAVARSAIQSIAHRATNRLRHVLLGIRMDV